jgi:hypothetical protein
MWPLRKPDVVSFVFAGFYIYERSSENAQLRQSCLITIFSIQSCCVFIFFLSLPSSGFELVSEWFAGEPSESSVLALERKLEGMKEKGIQVTLLSGDKVSKKKRERRIVLTKVLC